MLYKEAIVSKIYSLHLLWPPSKGDSRISLKQWFCLQLLIIADKEYIDKRKKKAALKCLSLMTNKILSLTQNHCAFKGKCD